MKLLSLLFVFALVLSSAQALNLQNVSINATGINTVVTIDDMNLSGVEFDVDYIYFSNVTYSNALQASLIDSISYNITVASQIYPQTDLPYYSASSGMAKTITHSIDQSLAGSVTFSVVTCSITAVYFDTLGTASDKVYSASEWSCDDSMLTLNYTGMHSGQSHFYVLADIVATACEVGNENASLYFSIYDEDTPAELMISEAEVELNYWIVDTPQFRLNFTVEFTGNNTYALCLNNNETSLNTDLYIKYTTENGFTHRYILANNTLQGGSPQNLSIFNFNTTTSISDLRITVRRNSNYQYYPNIIVKLQRRYVAEGVWRTVQMDKTGDFGLAFFNIREENTDYRLIFTDMSNNVLKTTNTLKLSCSSGICDLTVLLNPYAAEPASSELTYSYTYDPVAQEISFEWEDQAAGTSTMRIRARQDTATGAIYPCDQTQTGAAGTMTCDLSGRLGVLEFVVIGNSEIMTNELIDIKSQKLGDAVGNDEGAVWAVFIIVICVMFGLFSPVGAIISMLIGLIAIYLLGLFTPITITFLIIFTAIGIVIGIKVRN